MAQGLLSLHNWMKGTVIVKWTVNAKAKIGWQVCLLAWESDARCFHGHRLSINKKSRDKKNSEAKTKHFLTANSKRGNGGQSGQILGGYSKKDSCLYKRCQQGQFCNTPATCNNATIAKKYKNLGDRDLSQFKYYVCHKKGHYINKCPYREPKNLWQSWQFMRQ